VKLDLAARTAGRFLIVFVSVVLMASFIQVLPWVDANWVAPYLRALAKVCGSIIVVFGGAATVVGDVISSPVNGVSIRIDNGCSGIEAAILLIAAMVAFPSSLRLKAIGVSFGVSAILVVNGVRIISLFYLLQYSREWFDWAHLFLWDALIIIDGMLAFYVWARWLHSKTNA